MPKRWLRHNGTGPRSARVGGRVVFRLADVIAWVDAQFDEAGFAGMNRPRRDAHWVAKMRIAELTAAAREAAIRLLAKGGGEPEALALLDEVGEHPRAKP
ncbi:hypothetical protein AHiyo8_49040 [Arthrobacter sp. Hiyo8]|uniref:hypothetical protein n=1 Tax=Arthrobacter sp. Hiyo1 TaxID=1588020 RepID=UPI0006839277|nr:hypothetical protein [Arthrobacter sp. Hiyo1]BAS16601.1 hypothetical protein AHiyo8_49040 [Arthrobacter sp. Hiyo8]GAP57329.1 hypothetical protein AHiyo1_01610 [Arthrobacter sp. Hiyo1]